MYTDLVDVGNWRRKELTQLKAILPPDSNPTFECLSRGTMVLCYSHWEGYFNDLTESIFQYVETGDVSRLGFGATFQCLFLRSDIDRLRSSRFSDDSIIKFLQAYDKSKHSAKSMHLDPVRARSALNWERLCVVAEVYGISWIAFERKRIFIDHKLCRIRHEIAHGNSPRLTRPLALEIVDETLQLLDDLVDYFEEIQSRLGV